MGFLGFKQLFAMSNGDIVSPLYSANLWTYRTQQARHVSKYDGLNHKPLDCKTCGFHSYKRPEFLSKYSSSAASNAIYAVVDNSGRVIEHELGYRATHSKLIFTSPNRHNLLEWCDDSLEDHMPTDLIVWCNNQFNTSPWQVSGDHHKVIQNYCSYWLENDQSAHVYFPQFLSEAATNIRGWGQLA